MPELELSIDVELTVTVRFDPVKGFLGNRHEPPYPDHIDDLEVTAIHYDNGTIKEDVPVSVTHMQPTLDNAINFAVMCALDDEEWTDRCLESLEE